MFENTDDRTEQSINNIIDKKSEKESTKDSVYDISNSSSTGLNNGNCNCVDSNCISSDCMGSNYIHHKYINSNNIKSNNNLKFFNINKQWTIHGWKNFHLSIFLLRCINTIFIIFFPYLIVSRYDLEPVLSMLLLTTSIVWFFKMYSYHQVCSETRKLFIDNVDLNSVDDPSLDMHYIKTYPYCLNLKNHYTYILMPTMCFQFTYPRTEKIRWLQVIKHIINIICLLLLIKTTSEKYIYEKLQNIFIIEEFKSFQGNIKIVYVVDRLLQVCVPTLHLWFVGFLIIFHYWCNVLAELTKFGDRLFYKDWWNSISFADYWRKWNLPVHFFINRHINKPLICYGLNRKCSLIIIFIISAILHEYLISVPFKISSSGYIFCFFVIQIPLIQLTNNEYLKKHKTVGNFCFWFILCATGQPLILFVYYYTWSVTQAYHKRF
uniref:diacylglycerol O-acyltransferase n=1 Tax=Piliocolobus tephrosceles TaxID=591936 RepID=A0A8C9IJW9_9PRIM